VNFLKYFFGVAFIPLLIFGGISWYIEPISGDLTRLGNVSERSWGWHAKKSVVQVRRNDLVAPVDVIVVGDSFSIGNQWQSLAAEISGLQFATYQWGDIGGDGCLQDAVSLLATQHPTARYLVIESVERAFIDRFSNQPSRSQRCKAPIKSSAFPEGGSTQAHRVAFNKNDILPDAVYAIKALLNENQLHDGLYISGQAAMAPLIRNDLFSNQKSNSILFLREDLKRYQWTQAQLDLATKNVVKFVAVSNRVGLEPLMVVVPNKLTTYLPSVAQGVIEGDGQNIWIALDGSKVPSINLQPLFREKAQTGVDFYLPNDTHLSTDGYIFLGTLVGKVLKPVAANKARALN